MSHGREVGGRWEVGGGGEKEGRRRGGGEEEERRGEGRWRGEGYSMNHGAAPHKSSFTLLQHSSGCAADVDLAVQTSRRNQRLR